MNDAERELEWLRKARELSHVLVDETQPHTLLPQIMASAIELSSAERGFLVRLGPKGSLSVEVARGFDGQVLSSPEGAVSRRVVEEVLERGDCGVVTTREEDQPLLDATTMRERRVLAILCVPMRLRGQAVGVLYLDHRFVADAFRPGDVEPLRLFADQAALAIESRELASQRQRDQSELARVRERLHEHEAVERRRRRLLAVQRNQRAVAEPNALGRLVGESEAAQGFFVDLERGGRSLDPVLVVGEIGSGKSAASAELHDLSRRPGELVFVPCSSATLEQLEGAFQRAAAGTLVLESVGSTPAPLQQALIEELQRQRDGGAGARVVATHTGAPTELSLRPELLYRLDVLRVDVPALRHRRDDVPLLLDHHSDQAGRRLEFTPSALQLLVDYRWPGNLHELANLVRRLSPLEKTITTRDLPPEVRDGEGAIAPEKEQTLAGIERVALEQALVACGGNRAKTARRLGIPRSSLYRMLDRYGLR